MRVLITGATGFIGSVLTDFLVNKGIEIHYLSTSKNKIKVEQKNKGFYWNPNNLEIDPKCIDGVDFIINLAGKSIGCRWTTKNKSEILNSRIQVSKTLYKLLKENKNQVKKVISASAIGIYPNDFKKIQSENQTHFNSDFLGQICQQWEKENQSFNDFNIETLIVRFGLVLSEKEGALPQFANPIRLYFGGLLGSGIQWYSWIHVQDLVGMIYFGMTEEITGTVNGVAPNPKTQKEFLITLAKVLKRKLTMPRVPTFVLKLILGEMHHLITDSQRISADKILHLGFEFKYPILKEALVDLYKKSPKTY